MGSFRHPTSLKETTSQLGSFRHSINRDGTSSQLGSFRHLTNDQSLLARDSILYGIRSGLWSGWTGISGPKRNREVISSPFLSTTPQRKGDELTVCADFGDYCGRRAI